MTEREGLARRNFLRTAVGGAAAASAGIALTSTASAQPRGTSPADRAGRSHGRQIPNSKIAIQLYTVREAMDADPEATLAALAGAGYRNVEPFSLHGKTAQQFRQILDRLGLRAVSSHVGYEEVQGSALWRTLEIADILGQKYVVCPGGVDHSVEGFKEAAAVFNRAGAAARHCGMTFGYHNHESEFEKVDGKVLYDVLLSNTDPRLVTMQLDIGWAVAAGVDCVDLFRRHKNRFQLTHVKDINAQHKPVDLGSPEGIVEWERILTAATKNGVREFVIENDVPNDPRTSDRSEAMREWLVNFTF